jgi:ABC-type glucose/galactose transport system permease subunit
MIIMSNITKTSKIGIFAMIFIATALIGSVVAFGDNMAFATGKSNNAEQEIEQEQESEQNAQCVSGEITFASCNNIGIQLQEQLGDLALGQQ